MAAEVYPGILGVTSPKKCSCQELLSCDESNPTKSGWLRMKLKSKLIFNWALLFVVVVDKCLYYFKNEMSKKPSGAVSLHGFYKLTRTTNSSKNPWTFKLEHIQPDIRSFHFSSSSEKDMITWMKWIKNEMLVANDRSSISSTTLRSSDYKMSSDGYSVTSLESWGSSDYQALETGIYIEPVSEGDARISSMIDVCGDDDDSDDDDVPSAAAEPPPGRPFSYTDGSLPMSSTSAPGCSFQTNTSPDSKRSGADSYWSSVQFSGDKFEASSILCAIADPGVYLVRKGEQDSKVLVVYCAGTTKKYKIFEKEKGRKSLSSSTGPSFDSEEDMLYYYYSNNLPTCNQKLVTPYRLHPDFARFQ